MPSVQTLLPWRHLISPGRRISAVLTNDHQTALQQWGGGGGGGQVQGVELSN